MKPMLCDQLDEFSKIKLDKMLKEIDDNLDAIKQDKESYYRDMCDNKSQMSKYDNAENAYLYSKDNMQKMEQINDSLRSIAPMLPPPDYNDYDAQSVMNS